MLKMHQFDIKTPVSQVFYSSRHDPSIKKCAIMKIEAQ